VFTSLQQLWDRSQAFARSAHAERARGVAPAVAAASSELLSCTQPDTRAAALDPVHVRIRDLRKSFGEHVVLDSVSFDIYRGAMNVVVGASGSGKTVLLRQLLRLERPDAGSIEVDGEDIATLDDTGLMNVRLKMGVVFQDSALLDSMTVFDNVAFPLREHEPHIAEPDVHTRVMARLTALGVADAAEKLPAELSGGMKKRVAVARALITEPALLVFDEPTRGLDPITARSVDKLIRSTAEQACVTSLMISHDIKSVYDIADYVSLLRNGRIELTASRSEFFASDNVHVRAFVDASGIRFEEALCEQT
jgi:phospholipid/cholesterol/gamma-HCH transport system ATP-binding protein